MENDTLTCGHCGRVVKLVIKQDVRPERAAFEVNVKEASACSKCGRFVCNPCRNIPQCTPVEDRLERYEKRHRR